MQIAKNQMVMNEFQTTIFFLNVGADNWICIIFSYDYFKLKLLSTCYF